MFRAQHVQGHQVTVILVSEKELFKMVNAYVKSVILMMELTYPVKVRP